MNHIIIHLQNPVFSLTFAEHKETSESHDFLHYKNPTVPLVQVFVLCEVPFGKVPSFYVNFELIKRMY